MSQLPFEYPLRQLSNFWCDLVRPWIIEAEFGSGLFSGHFRRCFNGGAQWITQLVDVFSVGMVNSPESLARLPCRTRFHGDSSPEIKCVKMYQLHMIRGQS
jgi:hypothetical protein